MQWPVAGLPSKGGWGKSRQAAVARFFADGAFFTPDRKARFVAPERPAAPALCDAYPFTLNTGRVRDQWHTMTRTGKSAPARLAPAGALRRGAPGRRGAPRPARTATSRGSRPRTAPALLEVAVEDGQRPGSLFAPIHWSDETSSDGRVGALVHAVVDPVSGQPDAKATPAAIAPEPMAIARLRAVAPPARRRAPCAEGVWWARAAIDGGYGMLFATTLTAREIAEWAPALFAGAELAEYADDAAGVYRCAAVAGGQPRKACSSPARPRRGRIGTRRRRSSPRAARTASARARPVRARRRQRRRRAGPLVCACFGVGLAAIRDGRRSTEAAISPEAIGALLRAGTNCGSCVPEMKRIIARELAPQAG